MDFGPTSVNGRVFILTSAPPEIGGGVEHFVRELRKGLDLKGYRIEVFHRGNSEPTWLAKRTGRFSGKLAGSLRGYWIGRNAQRRMSDDVVAVISNSDVGFYPLHLHRRMLLRRIHFYHGTYRGQSEAIRLFIKYSGYLYLKWWNSMVLERMSGRNKLVLCNSEQTCEEVRDFFGFDSIPMWLPIDTERFKPLGVREGLRAFGLPPEKAIGLFVGSVEPTKGFPTVRKLVERLPEVYWVLVARGDVPTEMANLPNLRMLRNVPHDQMPLLYSAASFSLCPSLYESFGYVVAEALACGTPAIATAGGASRAFLNDPPLDRLLIAERASVDRFAAAAREVLRDPEFYRQKVKELARPRLVELMSPENWWRRFNEVTGL